MNDKSGQPDIFPDAVVEGWRAWLYLAPTSLLLLVLPIAHTTALRMVFLAGTAIAGVWCWRKWGVPKMPLLLAFSLCAVAAFASLSSATDAASSFDEIKKELGYGIVTFTTYFALSRSPRELGAWISALLASLFVLVAYTLWAYFREGTLNFDGRHGGVLNYSVFVATIFPLFLCALVYPGLDKRCKYVALAMIPLALLTGYLTENRSFWFAIVASSIAFVVLYIRLSPSRRVRLRLLVGVLGIVAISVIGLAGSAAQRLGSDEGFSANLKATLERDPRAMLWGYGIELIREHPLTGMGFGRMQQAHRFSEHFNDVPTYVHAHNIFINYGVQMGLPGIAAYLFLFFCVIREFSRLYRMTDLRAALIGIAGISIVVAVVLKSVTDDQFVRHNALLFWAMVGMGLGYGARLGARAPGSGFAMNARAI